MKRLTLLPIFVALALLLSSCSMHLGLSSLLGSKSSSTPAAKTIKATHTPPSAGSGTAVSIGSKGFRPKNISVKVGATLTWTNNDTTQQSVKSDAPGLFDSGMLAPGATFSYTFSAAGTFPYHSAGSNSIFGSVIVTP
jgi:plastocyanin